MSSESPPSHAADDAGTVDMSKRHPSEPESQKSHENAPERRHFRRYRMSMPVWLSYGHNFREVESGLVRNISKSGLFMVTEGGEDLKEGDLVKVNATFTVRGEAQVVRVHTQEGSPRGIALRFTNKLELDI